MKKIVSFAMAFAFVLGVTLVLAGDVPETITIKANEKKPVEFSHKVHADKYECNACHHTVEADETPKACTTCHQKKDGDAPKRMTAFHSKTSEISCVGCHKKAGGDAPVKCMACHPKK